MTLLRIFGIAASLFLLGFWAIGPTEYDIPIAMWLTVGLFIVPLGVGAIWFFWIGADEL